MTSETLRGNRANWTTAAGWLIILLGAASALLPVASARHGPLIVGSLLTAAGAVELAAGWLRQSARVFAVAAGAVTIAAGLMFLTRQETSSFLPTLYVVTTWLLVRSLVLVLVSLRAGRLSVRKWTWIAAATDFLLGLLLLAGLSIATLVVSLFGATEDMVASFSWVLALSFVATGTMLLEVGNCERSEAA